jgi:hypothetical protein
MSRAMTEEPESEEEEEEEVDPSDMEAVMLRACAHE